MGLAAFNRMRRIKGSALAEMKNTVPSPGMNIRETISETLKRQHIKHSMEDAEAAAQEAKLAMRDDAERGREPAINSVLEGVGPAGNILNTGEEVAAETKAEGPEASVVVAAGRIAGRKIEPEKLFQFSASHFAPQTSVSGGTDDDKPEGESLDDTPTVTSADPEWDEKIIAMRKEEREASEKDREKKKADYAPEEPTKQAIEEEREDEEREIKFSSSNADLADRGEAPNAEAIQQSLQKESDAVAAEDKRRLDRRGGAQPRAAVRQTRRQRRLEEGEGAEPQASDEEGEEEPSRRRRPRRSRTDKE